MVGGAVFVRVDALAGVVFVDEAVVWGAVGGGVEDVVVAVVVVVVRWGGGERG